MGLPCLLTGSFKYSFEVESLVNHTFYQPLQSAVGSDLKLPVIVWGNGGCKPWYVWSPVSHASLR